MKFQFSIYFVFFTIISFSQETNEKYYDTLYYKEDIIKPCFITKTDDKKVYFRATTKKGIVYTSSVSTKSLKYYVDYDSTGTVLLSEGQLLVAETDTTKIEYKMITDTVVVKQHHLSVNPVALGLLGFDLDYMGRLKKRPRLAIHYPFRFHTLFGNTLLFHTGLGVNFIPYDTKRVSLYCGVAAQYYYSNDAGGVGLPLSIGIISHLTPRLTLHANGGGGPFFGTYEKTYGIAVSDFHFGIGYKFGQELQVTTTNKKKVWK